MMLLGMGLMTAILLALALIPMLVALLVLWQGERARKR
jgi:hypothetical protein